jgi:hypothetical protein
MYRPPSLDPVVSSLRLATTLCRTSLMSTAWLNQASRECRPSLNRRRARPRRVGGDSTWQHAHSRMDNRPRRYRTRTGAASWLRTMGQTLLNPWASERSSKVRPWCMHPLPPHADRGRANPFAPPRKWAPNPTDQVDRHFSRRRVSSVSSADSSAGAGPGDTFWRRTRVSVFRSTSWNVNGFVVLVAG